MGYKDPNKQREYQRLWMARRRSEWMEANGPCVDCGSSEALEVDHSDQTTKVEHKVWSWSKVRREAELAKCVVRCYDCHMAKSVTERAKGVTNGMSILTEDQVREIRARYERGADSLAAIGRDYGIQKSTVFKIVTKKNWKHVA